MYCIPSVLTGDQIAKLNALFDTAQHLLQRGSKTAGYVARQVKNNLQIELGDQTREHHDLVWNALQESVVFQSVALPRHMLLPLLAQYGVGMEYGLHNDEARMGASHPIRTDLSVTVFLSDPSTYEGGELVLQTSLGETQIKLEAGEAVVYPTGELHRVAPVTSGIRRAAVTWVQSWVRDSAQRHLLHEANQCRLVAEARDLTAPDTLLLGKIHANLQRMWMDG